MSQNMSTGQGYWPDLTSVHSDSRGLVRAMLKGREALCGVPSLEGRKGSSDTLLETRGCPHRTLCLTAWKG